MLKSLISLIEKGDMETLTAWLREGRLNDLTEAEKNAIAHEATRRGQAKLLRLLCEECHGLSLAPDAEGRTLLHDAALSGDAETMRFVHDVLGMDALTGDLNCVTPLDIAAETGEEALRIMEELAGVRLKDCYRNPVLRGFYPDPSVVRVGEDYWMVNSSFVMLPALPISHSKDLVHWETVGHVFTDPDAARLTGLPGGHGYWAPDISYHQGRFWIVATLRRDTPPFRLQMITSAPSPLGPWTAPEFLEVNGIDPSLFTDVDGKRYLVINPGVRIARISEQGDLMEAPRMIWYGSDRRKSEGPHILKKDGWYYLFQAEGGTGPEHRITCARSRNLYGPYESCPFNPILGPEQENAYIRRGGHGKPVQLPDGRWAVLYLCGRQVEGKTLMGRETALDPMTWTMDGWPMVNNLQGPSCLQRMLLPDVPMKRRESWVCPREDWGTFAHEDADGTICLKGGKEPNSLQGVHVLLHRQRESRFTQTVRLDVSGMAQGSYAGLLGYYDENSYFFFGLQRGEKICALYLIERAGETVKRKVLGMIKGLQASLTVRGDGLERTVSCAEKAGETVFRVEYLTDEGLKMGKRFTGAMLGLAAVGDGEARFSSYREDMTEA